MAAPKGNQFWKARSKHGRDAIFQDPKKLAESADQYFQWCVDNPIRITKMVGEKAITEILPRVFTKEGISLFCGLCEWRLITDLKNKGDDFSLVIKEIETTIYTQKITYACVKVFDSNIIARDLGLKDRQDMTTNDQDIKPINWVSDDKDSQ